MVQGDGSPTFDDWVRAPNIADNLEVYERENEAIARDGSLDRALSGLADWTDRTFLDVGCGAGFWLPAYASTARRVIGVEPDPELRVEAAGRVARLDNVDVRAGSAEHLPLDDESVDVAHARFAYFFGAGAERGLEEVGRVLRSGGTFVAVDNDWSYGEFAELLRDASEGNAAIDPTATDRWWREQGAERVDVRGAWECGSPEELEAILRIEFPNDTVDRFLERHRGRHRITYGFALFVWQRPTNVSHEQHRRTPTRRLHDG